MTPISSKSSLIYDPMLSAKVRIIEGVIDHDDEMDVQFMRRQGKLYLVKVTCTFKPEQKSQEKR